MALPGAWSEVVRQGFGDEASPLLDRAFTCTSCHCDSGCVCARTHWGWRVADSARIRGTPAIGANIRRVAPERVILICQTPCHCSRRERGTLAGRWREPRRPQPPDHIGKKVPSRMGRRSKGGEVHDSAMAFAPFPACPPGRHPCCIEDPVVPGLITGLHHRLSLRAPSGSKFQLREKPGLGCLFWLRTSLCLAPTALPPHFT